MKQKQKPQRQGFSSQTNADRRSESRTALKDKMNHLMFKLKMLESWIYEKRAKKEKDSALQELETKQHNMKYEYNRVCKLLKESKS